MKQLLWLAIFLLSIKNKSFSQTQLYINGQVLDVATQKPVTNATIQFTKTNQATISDSLGGFKLFVNDSLPISIRVSATGFYSQIKMVTVGITVTLFLESATSQLDEVVVTGTGSATKIKSTPISISVVSAREMANHPNTNAIDALSRSIPGLQTVTTGPNVSKPSIRGLGYNRVLTLLDGIRQEGQQWADEHGIEADQYNIEKAEVIKGPASIAYGSDAIAGVINIIPFIPQKQSENLAGNALAEYFSNNNMMATSWGLHQFKKDFFWSGRASFKMAKDYRNQVDGRVFNTGFQEWNISALGGWKKSWGESYTAVTVYNNFQEIPDGSRDSLTRKFTYQIAEGALDDMTTRPVVSGNRLNSYAIDPLHQHIRHYRFYNKTNLQLGGGQLQSAISFTKNIRQEYNHPTVPQQAGLYVVLNTFQLSEKWNTVFADDYRFTTGINAMYQTNRSKSATDFPIPDYNMSDVGAFVMLEKEWKKLTVSGGVRYDNRHIRWNNFYLQNNPATGFDYPVSGSDTAGANLAFSNYSKNFNGLTASIGATYTLSANWFVKANVGRGYRSPNITEAGANGLDPGAHIYYIGNRNFSPEFNWQQDLGIFYTNPSIEVGVELFNNDVRNYIFLQKLLDASGQPIELVPGNSTYSYRQGNARLYGIDASIKYHPRSVRWFHFQSTISSVTGINKDAELLKQYGDDARYLPLISPLRVLSAVRFQAESFSKTIQKPWIRLELDAFAAQNKFYAVQSTETATPGYALLNASAGFSIGKKVAGKEWLSISLNAENIFDLAYQSHLNRLKYFETYTHSPNGRYGIYNMGRNLCLRAAFSF